MKNRRPLIGPWPTLIWNWGVCAQSHREKKFWSGDGSDTVVAIYQLTINNTEMAMRMHRAARVAASADASIGALRGCASRPRFLCLNAPTRAFVAPTVTWGKGAQRYFSESRSIRAGAAEAV